MLPQRNLKILLWLIAIHSFVTGVLLIESTPEMLSYFGYTEGPGFFSTQGGVFHMVMVIAYLMTAYNLGKESMLIWFCITAKMMATAFLVLYFFLFEQIWVVLASGFGDFVMGVLLWIAFLKYKHYNNA